MSEELLHTIKTALSQVIDREEGRDVISLGMISGMVVRAGGKVGFLITIDPKDKERKAYLREACEAAVKSIAGISSVTAVLTAQNATPIPPKPEAGYDEPRQRAQWNQTPLPHVKKIIAVASGKGGVGKSTTTVNLALSLTRAGKKVGVLDADIYGPSLPRMLGVSGQPEIIDGKMQPLTAHGLVCMSMGLITGDEAAILRGPMISKTLQQMLRMTNWGSEAAPLDYLLVDMPPGTGDIALSMAQQVPLTGVIIVTTPQDIATIDADKCLRMFAKMNVPILGVIENMSYYIDNTGNRIALFGEGGGKKLANEHNTQLLGEIPIDIQIREYADQGLAYDGTNANLYHHMAQELITRSST